MLDMLRIGVLSDTHLIKITEDFKIMMKKVFGSVHMLIHAGDMTGLEVYDYLCNWELKAVRGNMDDSHLKTILPEKRVEEIMGKRIGIIHGRGAPIGIEHMVYDEFKDVDAIIFGHSHFPLHTKKGNTFLFNPGTYKSSFMYTGTAGIMEIDNEIRFRHIEVK